MAILLWWSVASIGVSLFLGAFLSYGRREDETLDLDFDVQVDVESRETQPNLT